jgi:hypothetical protein
MSYRSCFRSSTCQAPFPDHAVKKRSMKVVDRRATRQPKIPTKIQHFASCGTGGAQNNKPAPSRRRFPRWSPARRERVLMVKRRPNNHRVQPAHAIGSAPTLDADHARRSETMPDTCEWWTPQELAAHWRVSLESIRRQIASGKIPTLKIRSLHRIHRDVIQELEREGKAVKPPPATSTRRHKRYGRPIKDHFPDC